MVHLKTCLAMSKRMTDSVEIWYSRKYDSNIREQALTQCHLDRNSCPAFGSISSGPLQV